MNKEHKKGKIVKAQLCDCDPNFSFFKEGIEIGMELEKFNVCDLTAASIECPNCGKLLDKIMIAEDSFGKSAYIPLDMVEIHGYNPPEFVHLNDNYKRFKECHGTSEDHNCTKQAFMAGALFIMKTLNAGRHAAKSKSQELMAYHGAVLNLHDNFLLRYGMEQAGMSPAAAAEAVCDVVDVSVDEKDNDVDIGAHIKSIIDKLREGGDSGKRSITPKPSSDKPDDGDGNSFAN